MNIADRSPGTSAATIMGEGIRLTAPKTQIINKRNGKKRKNLALFVLVVVAVEEGMSTEVLLLWADVDPAPDPPARLDSCANPIEAGFKRNTE